MPKSPNAIKGTTSAAAPAQTAAQTELADSQRRLETAKQLATNVQDSIRANNERIATLTAKVKNDTATPEERFALANARGKRKSLSTNLMGKQAMIRFWEENVRRYSDMVKREQKRSKRNA